MSFAFSIQNVGHAKGFHKHFLNEMILRINQKTADTTTTTTTATTTNKTNTHPTQKRKEKQTYT